MFQAKISNICRLEGRSNSNRLHHFGLWQIVINSSDFTLDRRIVKISIRLINLKNVKKNKKIFTFTKSDRGSKSVPNEQQSIWYFAWKKKYLFTVKTVVNCFSSNNRLIIQLFQLRFQAELVLQKFFSTSFSVNANSN